MFKRRPEKSPDEFWQEYEEKTSEKVMARGLGRYISGWEEFDSRNWSDIWGLIIAGSKSFRFHHFPQQSWLSFFSPGGSSGVPKEKTFSIPYQEINSVKLLEETKWWIKIFKSDSPRLIINYRDETGSDKQLLLEAGFGSGELAEKLIELSG